MYNGFFWHCRKLLLVDLGVLREIVEAGTKINSHHYCPLFSNDYWFWLHGMCMLLPKNSHDYCFELSKVPGRGGSCWGSIVHHCAKTLSKKDVENDWESLGLRRYGVL